MGASQFDHTAVGRDVDDAFRVAREEAQYDYGHSGYSGTIAEKHDYVVVRAEPTSDAAAGRLVDKLMQADDRRVTDKWGPAGAIRLTNGGKRTTQRWLFFGYASS